MITTTLKAIRKASPCGLKAENGGELTGYLKLKHFLGENRADAADAVEKKIQLKLLKKHFS